MSNIIIVYQTLHVMGRKCQMFINVIRATLKDFEWFPDFVVFVSFMNVAI